MKKSYFKKIFSIVLLLAVIVTALNLTVSARYNYIDLLSSGLSINSIGLATCTGVVTPSYNDTKATLNVELQKKVSNNVWSPEGGAWSGSGTGNNPIAVEGKKYVVHGTYRVLVTAKIYSSSSGALLETQSMYSPEVTY